MDRSMPRFFFNVHDDAVTADDEGVELPDAEAARLEAIRGARSLACEQVSNGYLNVNHRIEVHDSLRREVATIRFGEAIRIETS